MTKLYEYTITFEGELPGVVIEAVDAGHAYSEMLDDLDLWPEGSVFRVTPIISIVRGAERPYGTDL